MAEKITPKKHSLAVIKEAVRPLRSYVDLELPYKKFVNGNHVLAHLHQTLIELVRGGGYGLANIPRTGSFRGSIDTEQPVPVMYFEFTKFLFNAHKNQFEAKLYAEYDLLENHILYHNYNFGNMRTVANAIQNKIERSFRDMLNNGLFTVDNVEPYIGFLSTDAQWDETEGRGTAQNGSGYVRGIHKEQMENMYAQRDYQSETPLIQSLELDLTKIYPNFKAYKTAIGPKVPKNWTPQTGPSLSVVDVFGLEAKDITDKDIPHIEACLAKLDRDKFHNFARSLGIKARLNRNALVDEIIDKLMF